MKLLPLLAALLVSATAQATVVAEGTLKDGRGVIRLTDESSNCATRNKFAYIRANDGRVVPGCWTLEDGDIFVKYRDGDVMLYPISNFEWRFQEKPAAQKQKGSML